MPAGAEQVEDMEKKFMAFDFGASSGRAILGRLENGKLTMEEIHRFSNDPVEICGHYHWDIFRLFFEIKQGLIKYANMGYGKLDGIGIDTWGVDFGLLGKDGELLGAPYHYRDKRTDGMMEQAQKLMPRREIFRHSGVSFEFFNTLNQLLAMKLASSAALEGAQELLFIPDLFAYFLTGNKGTEFCEATTSQMIDPETGDWSEDIIKAMGFPRRIFGRIEQPGTLRGMLLPSVCKECGLEPTPVYVVASHDTNAASAAVPAQGENWAFLSSGTWSLLGIEVDKPVVNDVTYERNFSNEGAIGGRYDLLSNIMGLWIIQQLRADWERAGEKLSFPDMVKLAQEAQPFKCFINPDDKSFVAPVGMEERIRAYCERTGQEVPLTRGEVIRTAYESLALKYREAIDDLEKITGKRIDVLHIVGGGCQNLLLNRMTANAIGRKVVTGPAEGTAMGNILIQAMGEGSIKDVAQLREVVRASVDTGEYLPQDKQAWDEAYARYCRVTKC